MGSAITALFITDFRIVFSLIANTPIISMKLEDGFRGVYFDKDC